MRGDKGQIQRTLSKTNSRKKKGNVIKIVPNISAGNNISTVVLSAAKLSSKTFNVITHRTGQKEVVAGGGGRIRDPDGLLNSRMFHTHQI